MDFTLTFSLLGRETTTIPSGQRSHHYMSCDGHSMSAHTVPTVMYGVGRGEGEGYLQFLCPRERVLSAEAVTSVLV